MARREGRDRGQGYGARSRFVGQPKVPQKRASGKLARSVTESRLLTGDRLVTASAFLVIYLVRLPTMGLLVRNDFRFASHPLGIAIAQFVRPAQTTNQLKGA